MVKSDDVFVFCIEKNGAPQDKLMNVPIWAVCLNSVKNIKFVCKTGSLFFTNFELSHLYDTTTIPHNATQLTFAGSALY